MRLRPCRLGAVVTCGLTILLSSGCLLPLSKAKGVTEHAFRNLEYQPDLEMDTPVRVTTIEGRTIEGRFAGFEAGAQPGQDTLLVQTRGSTLQFHEPAVNDISTKWSTFDRFGRPMANGVLFMAGLNTFLLVSPYGCSHAHAAGNDDDDCMTVADAYLGAVVVGGVVGGIVGLFTPRGAHVYSREEHPAAAVQLDIHRGRAALRVAIGF